MNDPIAEMITKAHAARKEAQRLMAERQRVNTAFNASVKHSAKIRKAVRRAVSGLDERRQINAQLVTSYNALDILTMNVDPQRDVE